MFFRWMRLWRAWHPTERDCFIRHTSAVMRVILAMLLRWMLQGPHMWGATRFQQISRLPMVIKRALGVPTTLMVFWQRFRLGAGVLIYPTRVISAERTRMKLRVLQ